MINSLQWKDTRTKLADVVITLDLVWPLTLTPTSKVLLMHAFWDLSAKLRTNRNSWVSINQHSLVITSWSKHGVSDLWWPCDPEAEGQIHAKGAQGSCHLVFPWFICFDIHSCFDEALSASCYLPSGHLKQMLNWPR